MYVVIVAADDLREDVFFLEDDRELFMDAFGRITLEKLPALLGAEDEMSVQLVVGGHETGFGQRTVVAIEGGGRVAGFDRFGEEKWRSHDAKRS